MIQKNVLITEEQDRFIEEQRRSFKFSKFVRAKLNEYIKFIKGGKNGKK